MRTQKSLFTPFSTSVTKEQSKDAGLVLVLVLLILLWVWPEPKLQIASIGCLLLAMTLPAVFRPFAIFWFGLSSLLGALSSKVLLSFLFFAMVTPVGLVRRLMGKDSMQLKLWKNDENSVFKIREHVFEPKDLEHPY